MNDWERRTLRISSRLTKRNRSRPWEKGCGGGEFIPKQVGIPVIAGVIIAAAVMGIDGRFGPPPRVLPFKYGAVVVHIPWLLALLLIGAGAAFLSRRAGASLSRRLLCCP